MERNMLDTSEWTRSAGMHLCKKIYIDISGDLNDSAYLSQQMNLLVEELQSMGIHPMNTINSDNINMQPLPGIYFFIFILSKIKVRFLVDKMFLKSFRDDNKMIMK